MSIATSIVARLQAQTSSFRIVASATEFQRVGEKPRAAPALFVLLLHRQAEPSEMVSIVRNDTAVMYGLVTVTADFSTPGTGAAVAADIEDLSDEAITALLGWTPEGASAPIEYAGGQLMDSKGGHVWWQDAVLTRRLYSSV